MKSYTDIEQSKVLEKILPLESSDMRFCYSHTLNGRIIGHYPMIGRPIIGREPSMGTTPCWSLAALFGVLPFHLIVNNQRYAFDMCKGYDRNGDTYLIRYNIYNTDISLYRTNYYNNPIDACYEMILKLHELNLLLL
jgi:hypothetical protein